MDDWIIAARSEMYRNNISNRDLAKLTGYGETYISKIFRGKKNGDKARTRIKQALRELHDKHSGEDA